MDIYNIYGTIIYSSDKETIKEALEEANLSMANLSEANLSMANLSEANLSEANLSMANLYGADLFGANLSMANLSMANLYGADLFGANLSMANLSMANLSEANLYGADLFGANLSRSKLPIFSKWTVSIIDESIIKIGCKEKTIEGWDSFFASDAEFLTNRGTPDFIRIEANYLAAKAYVQHLNSKS